MIAKNFPVPKEEAEKLEVVEHSLQEQPALQKLDRLIRAEPWRFVLGAAAVGFLVATAFRGR